jgi:hypothetical protein
LQSGTRDRVDARDERFPQTIAWNFVTCRFEPGCFDANFEAAIQVARQAVASTPKDHSDLAGHLNNLSNKLGRRYERTEDMADLNGAIQVPRQVVASTPGDHSNHAGRLNNLESRYERTANKADLQEANRVCGRSWTSYSSASFARICAASRCLKLRFHLK